MLTHHQFQNLVLIFVMIACGFIGSYLGSIGVSKPMIFVFAGCFGLICGVLEIVMFDFFVEIGLIEKKGSSNLGEDN